MKSTYYIILALITVIIIILGYGLDQSHKVDIANTNLNSINDSVSFYRDKDNRSVAKISTLEGSLDDLNSYKNLPADIEALRKEINKQSKLLKKGGSGTYIENNNYIDSTVTNIYSDNNLRIATLNNDWVNDTIYSYRDSSRFILRHIDKYVVVIGRERDKNSKKWVKPYKSVVTVTNLNPYTSTTTVRSMKVTDNVSIKRFGIGPNAGIGIGNGLKATWYIGIGINYNLIVF